jgi:hypothetical protein
MRGGNAWTATLSLENKAVQCLAADPHSPVTVYAGTCGSGVWKSGDGGASWENLEMPQPNVFSCAVSAAAGAVYASTDPGAQKDVHALAWHPTVPGRAYEAGGGGAAWSRGCSEAWEPAEFGRDQNYCWVWPST